MTAPRVPMENTEGYGDMLITRDFEAGSITVLQADDRIRVSQEVLDEADPTLLSVADGVMTITASNGIYRYQMFGLEERAPWYEARRIRD